MRLFLNHSAHRALHSASEGSVLRHTAVIAFGSPLKASEKSILHCAKNDVLKDVMDPYYDEICLLARQGCYLTYSLRVSHLFERPNVMYFHELCRLYHQN